MESVARTKVRGLTQPGEPHESRVLMRSLLMVWSGLEREPKVQCPQGQQIRGFQEGSAKCHIKGRWTVI